MIYYSTGGFSKVTAIESVNLLSKIGVKNFELSGGVHFFSIKEKLENLKTKLNCNFAVHNYFPPPEIPFVLNLASLDANVRSKSIAHCKESIKLAAILNSHFYSVHAGFLLDPKPSQLGKKFTNEQLANRHQSMEIFLETLKMLSEYAREFKINLMIENNVLSKNNAETFQDNPFLMADLEETIYIMDNTSDNVHLLVDVAHLKVSANSLKFDPVEYLAKTQKYTRGYHLSDNDGTSDSNKEFHKDAWFWDHIKKDLKYYSIEVYTDDTKKIINQIKLAEDKIYNG